jgi:hypothetical protein
LALQIVPAIPLACLIWVFPESPRWLIKVGREEEGLAALARLHARGDTTDTFVVAEFEEIRASIAEENMLSQGAFTQIFTKLTNVRRFVPRTGSRTGSTRLIESLHFSRMAGFSSASRSSSLSR